METDHRILEVQDLKKYFQVIKGVLFSKTVSWIKAVDRVSFSIGEGKTFGLVGESGCGKTTTAKVILLLEKATAGSVLFRGREISKLKGHELSEYRSSVQAVFQDPYSSLSPRMRVGKFVAEPLVINSGNKIARKVIEEKMKEVLAQVGLNPETANLFPHEFSGGQRQRVAIARALVIHPDLIILDEPVSALDVSIRAQIMNLLRDLQEQLGFSYLLIAHNLATVMYLSHSIGVMYLGKLVERGFSKEVFANRLHPYTKALISAALTFDSKTVKEERLLPSEVPNLLNAPLGCSFNPRCSFAKAVCRETEPELKEVAPNYCVACHLY